MSEANSGTKGARTAQKPSKTLNQKVYDWARQQRGRRVGGGECWHLADHALRNAGARSSTTTGRYDNYVWGTSIDAAEAMQGDILQFDKHKQTVTIETETKYSDGRVDTDVLEPFDERPHHTAVVVANNGSKGIDVLEQNYPEGSSVVLATIYFRSGLIEKGPSKPGTVREGKTVHHVMIKVTKSVEKTGWVYAYRPQAKP